MILLVSEGFSPIQAYVGAEETFHIDVTEVIARCERVEI